MSRSPQQRPLDLASTEPTRAAPSWSVVFIQWLVILGLCFVYAGDAPPNVNEAHYLAKAKNFWDPTWCHNDLFVASGKAHAVFYWVFGWPTLWFSLSTSAWIGRFVGWGLLAAGLLRLCGAMRLPYGMGPLVTLVWIAGLQQGNLAGEWVVGGIEAKVPAYALVLFGLAELLRKNWNATWVLFGAAAAFHVLTGGWAVVAAGFAFLYLRWVRRDGGEPHCRLLTPGLFLGGAISLLGVLPALAMSSGASSAEVTSAAKVYTYFRISHHLLPSAFHFDWYVRHGVLTTLTLFSLWLLWRDATADRRGLILSLAAFTVGAMMVSVMGLVVGMLPAVAPDWSAKLLRFYWFRLADAITPLALGLSVAGLLTSCLGRQDASSDSEIMRRLRMRLQGKRRWAIFSGCVLVLLVSIASVIRSTLERASGGVPISHSNRLLGLDRDADYWQQRQVMSDWVKVCRFVRANTSPDAILLTPRHQQSFKWYAHRAEVVNWKDIPQDVVSLRRWASRFVEVYPVELSTMRVTIRYDQLRRFRERYGVDWMVVDRRVVGPHLPLVQVYPLEEERNATYAIYRLPSLLTPQGMKTE